MEAIKQKLLTKEEAHNCSRKNRSTVDIKYSVGQKSLIGFEIWRHRADSSSACPQTANYPITEDSSSFLATQDEPFSPTLYVTLQG